MAIMARLGRLQVSLNTLLLVCFEATRVLSIDPWAVTDWGEATATFYGGQDASGTMGGACGYGNLYSTGYGVQSTALSNALLNNGLTCGACFALECRLDGSKWCYPGKEIVVTATNACPPGSEGGWCDPPKLHFDLSYPMFSQLAQPVAGVIPVKYKRVTCQKQGGIRFTMHGNPWFDYVLVYNVGGMGAVCGVAIKGDKTGWYPMSQNWGQYWSASSNLVGQALSFQVRLCDGNTQEFHNVAPSNWGFGQTFEADNNFY
ncbi:hypothetical protein R1flu_007545 [Riccia fluitans]|uniref:Expansin n=1 Tax=Riccia fluitans TaxID=41844 RepID=A0ABD1YZQ5_9MARC